jgi:hypothetical protein
MHFTILLFDSLNASVHPANATSRVIETQNLMLFCLCHMLLTTGSLKIPEETCLSE